MGEKVWIVIVNWNGWRDTIECLESVLGLEYEDFRVVVCDNGSTDESLIRLEQWFASQLFKLDHYAEVGSRVDLCGTSGGVECELETQAWGPANGDAQFVLIALRENRGFGAGCNAGIRYALASGNCKYVWLLNNDTVVDPSALTALVERMREKPSAGMCGSTLRHYDDPRRIQAQGGAVYSCWLGLAWHLGRMRHGVVDIAPERIESRMDYVVGASLLASCSFIEDVGLLDEEYFLYFEELDWAQRAKGRYGLAYAPKSVVYHKVGRSVGTATDPRRKSMQCDYYTLRNRLIFTRRYCPKALIGIYIVMMAELLLRIVVGRWDLASMILRLLKGEQRAEPGTVGALSRPL